MTNLTLNEMRLRALGQIEERFCPPNILTSPEYWDYLASMINQTLEIRRMVFFERVRDTRELRAIKAFNCTFEELQTRERTLDASVFAPALAAGYPVRVSGLFKNSAAADEEYLCPLAFGGEVLGLWAVNIEADKARAVPQFEVVLLKFSQQIARSLSRKRPTSDH